MCGLAGVVNRGDGVAPPERAALLRMLQALGHRGPDGAGLYRSAHAGLAHTRLSLVDLAGGAQPLSDAHQRVWVAFNGEIYNHRALRQDLQALGHRLTTQSDTEVIAAAWLAWGAAAFERFNGQWAVALWAPHTRTLALARDPTGICPLVWREHAGRLWFASEAKALFAGAPEAPRALDPTALAQTLTFWCPVAPQTPFEGVHELPPGEVWTLSPQGERRHQVPLSGDFSRAVGDAAFTGSLDDAAKAVGDRLQQAVALRITQADVPVGAYVSGGLDSALIAVLAQRSGSNLNDTFSLGFDDAEYDETPHQAELVHRLGSRHHHLQVGRRDIAQALSRVVWHTEKTLVRSGPVPLYLLSGLVRRSGIKTVLTGEGADEWFAGYDLFREARIRRFWARQPQSTLRPRLLERLYPYLSRSPSANPAMTRQFFGRGLDQADQPGFGHSLRWQAGQALYRLLSPDWRSRALAADVVPALLHAAPKPQAGTDALARDQHLEIVTLLQGYLLSSQGDRVLMGHGVEGRYPFLDPAVGALAHRLPARYRLMGLDEKHVLKRVALQVGVPATIVNRPKQPYRSPDALCLVGDHVPDEVAHALSPSALQDTGVFDPQVVARLQAKCTAQARVGPLAHTDHMGLVAVVTTQMLHGHLAGGWGLAAATPQPAPTLTVDVLCPFAPP